MRDPLTSKPRRWWQAAILAVAARGGGQLYNGQPLKAVLAYGLPLAVLYGANRAPAPLVAQALLLAFAGMWLWSVIDAAILAYAQRKAYAPRRFNRPAAYAAAIAVVWTCDSLVVSGMLLRVVTAPEGGMAPAIATGDRIIADITAYALDEPQRGDIVVFRSPVDDRSRRISRVVAVPGETIEIRDKSVLVNSRALRENWGVHSDPHVLWPTSPSPRDHYGPLRLGANAYFVLDDNRDVGFDSRHWNRPVARGQIEGKAGIYLFSRNPQAGIRWQRIGHPAQRAVPVPTDASRALYATMGSGPTLSAPAGFAIAALLLAGTVAVPFAETRRRRRRRLAAADPYSVELPAPACGSEAVRAQSAPLTEVGVLLARLRAVADASKRAFHALDVPLAQCLNSLSVARARPEQLHELLAQLDAVADCGKVRDVAVRGLLQWRRAGALHRLARLRGDDAMLDRALVAYRAALAETQHDYAPLRWAAIQNDLGTALQHRGEQAADPTYFEHALVAYRAALQHRTERKAPLDWATTQHNLGNCLRLLGERERQGTKLFAAAAAYRAALTQRTRDVDPVGHAMTLNNLGIALRLVGARGGDPGPVLQALRHHHESLRILEHHAPAYAAVPEHNLEDDAELLRRLGVGAGTSLPRPTTADLPTAVAC